MTILLPLSGAGRNRLAHHGERVSGIDGNSYVTVTVGGRRLMTENLRVARGRICNWYAVNDPRPLDKRGWHVATDREWSDVAATSGGERNAGSGIVELMEEQKVITRVLACFTPDMQGSGQRRNQVRKWLSVALWNAVTEQRTGLESERRR
jgi:hypothetical protein